MRKEEMKKKAKIARMTKKMMKTLNKIVLKMKKLVNKIITLMN